MSMQRATTIAGLLAERELDALLVTDLANLRWLTGFTGSNGLAVVGAGEDGLRRFLTDFRYLSQSAEQLDAAWEREIAQDLHERLAQGLEGPLRLGFDDAHMSVKEHARLQELLGDGIDAVPAAGLVEGRRAIKEPVELDAIRAAAKLADDGLADVLTRGLVGRTEREVALDLEFTLRRMGAEAVSFEPIVAAGPHGALPHAVPRDVAIPAGTLVVIDWGAQLGGYSSDCTRTYATGELDPRDREVYEIVLRAQEEALAAIAPGPTGRDIDAIARDAIEAAGHGEHFGHGLGHGVGLEIHEGPRLSRQGADALEAGNVVTVEPGIYVPGAVGVRIEDLVVVTAEGHEVLTSLPKTLTTVG
jgi:Xaa-Pro aminopeptidase